MIGDPKLQRRELLLALAAFACLGAGVLVRTFVPLSPVPDTVVYAAGWVGFGLCWAEAVRYRLR